MVIFLTIDIIIAAKPHDIGFGQLISNKWVKQHYPNLIVF